MRQHFVTQAKCKMPTLQWYSYPIELKNDKYDWRMEVISDIEEKRTTYFRNNDISYVSKIDKNS